MGIVGKGEPPEMVHPDHLSNGTMFGVPHAAMRTGPVAHPLCGLRQELDTQLVMWNLPFQSPPAPPGTDRHLCSVLQTPKSFSLEDRAAQARLAARGGMELPPLWPLRDGNYQLV